MRSPVHAPNALRTVLAATAIGVGALAFTYGFAGWLATRHEPLAGLLLLGIAMPALPPLLLGVMLLRGHRWALHALRAVIVLLLLGGAWLTWGFGLTVFSCAPFDVAFVGACLLWLALSFALDRGKLRVPKSVLAEARLEVGDVVDVRAVDGTLVVSRTRGRRGRVALEDLVAALPAAAAHRELDWGAPEGDEV